MPGSGNKTYQKQKDTMTDIESDVDYTSTGSDSDTEASTGSWGTDITCHHHHTTTAAGTAPPTLITPILPPFPFPFQHLYRLTLLTTQFCSLSEGLFLYCHMG